MQMQLYVYEKYYVNPASGAENFVGYINQRKVDSVTIININNSNTYTFNSSKQEFDIILSKNNSFNIFIKTINGEDPINLKNSNDIIQSYSILFGDEDTYINLLD